MGNQAACVPGDGAVSLGISACQGQAAEGEVERGGESQVLQGRAVYVVERWDFQYVYYSSFLDG